MIKKVLIIIVLILLMFLCFKININDNDNNDNNDDNNRSIIHSSKLNKGFFINGYNDDDISKIQLSLNKRDNIYKIKGNKLFLHDKFIKGLFNVC